MKLLCIDSFATRLAVDSARTPEGYVTGRVTVTRCGVFDYVDPRSEAEGRSPSGIIRVARLPKYVLAKKAQKGLERVPFQVDHVVMLDAANMAQYKVGNSGSIVEVEGEEISVDFTVDDAKGIAAIEAGKDGVSCGYYHGLVFERGRYGADEFDAYQTDYDYNHIALCKDPRLGDDLRIAMIDSMSKHPAGASGDSTPPRILFRATGDSHQKPNTEPSMTRKITLDSIDYEVPPQVAVAIEKMQGDAKTSATALTTANTAKEAAEKALKAEQDSHDATKALLKAEKDGFEEKVKTATAERVSVDSTAKRVLGEAGFKAMDGKPVAEVKMAVVKVVHPKLALDGKSADFVNTLFEAVSADDTITTSNTAAALRAAAGGNKSTDADESEDALLEEQRKSLTGLATSK
jgi:hypothetical protein